MEPRKLSHETAIPGMVMVFDKSCEFAIRYAKLHWGIDIFNIAPEGVVFVFNAILAEL